MRNLNEQDTVFNPTIKYSSAERTYICGATFNEIGVEIDESNGAEIGVVTALPELDKKLKNATPRGWHWFMDGQTYICERSPDGDDCFNEIFELTQDQPHTFNCPQDFIDSRFFLNSSEGEEKIKHLAYCLALYENGILG